MDTVIVDEFIVGDMSYSGGKEEFFDMGDMAGSTQQVSVADKLISSWVFVGGLSTGVLVIGVLLGLLSAKRKIKKGIDLYED